MTSLKISEADIPRLDGKVVIITGERQLRHFYLPTTPNDPSIQYRTSLISLGPR